MNPSRFFSEPPPAGDPYFANVTLLLHADDLAGASSLDDVSNTNTVATCFSGATTSVAQKLFSKNTLLVGSGGGYATVPANAGFNAQSVDFTAELFIRPSSSASLQVFLSGRDGASGNGWQLSVTSSRHLQLDCTGSFLQSSAGLVAWDTWHHVGFCKKGGTGYLLLNGAVVASGAITIGNNSTYPLYIGRRNLSTPAFNFNGYLAQIRLTKGVARYIAAYTVPTEPFPNS